MKHASLKQVRSATAAAPASRVTAVLILLPPSEGKAVPRRGAPLRLEQWPADLASPRRAVVEALVAAAGRPDALQVLKLPASMTAEVERDARLLELPTAPAERIYTGVLFEALGLATLSPAARRRASRRLLVTSSVFGVVRPAERIPAYRLSGDLTLPGLGGVAAHWREHLDPVIRAAAGRGLIVDLRSSTYAAFWRPAKDLAPRVAGVRVLHETDGKRGVVSHFNKATKGRLVRALIEDGRDARNPAALADLLTDLGWKVETDGTRLDVIVTDL